MTDLPRVPERNELERQLASWMSTVAVEPSTDWLDAAIAVARDHRQARPVPRLPRIPNGHRRPSTIMLARIAAAVLVIVAGVVIVEHRGRAPEPVQTPTPTTAIPSTPTTAIPSTSTSMPVVGGSPALLLPTFPDGKLIASLSAVSDSEWFAVSDFGPVDGHQSYPKLWHTNDAGVTWVDNPISADVAGGAHWVHFADPLNGWLWDQCCFFGTHDGGVTWKPIDGVQPMGDERAVGAIASAGGRVYLFADVSVVGHLGNSQVGVMSSPVDRDEFVWSGTEMLNGTWGLTPWSSQLVIRGDSGWAIAYGTTSPSPSTSGTLGAPPGAVRRINGEWTGWDPPCAVSLEGEQQLTTIQVPRLVLGASPSGATVAVVCKQATGGGPLRTFVSGDGGTTFVEAAPLPAGVTMTERSWLLVPDDNTILLGVALDTGELVVEGSHDGGRSWTVETSIANAKEFATATVTPTGQIVVVAGTEGRSRNDQGTWVPTGNTRKG